MIRKRIHRRWSAGDDGATLWRAIQRHKSDSWTDRYMNWSVERYGSAIGSEPWYVVPISLVLCWYQDWRATWRIRP